MTFPFSRRRRGGGGGDTYLNSDFYEGRVTKIFNFALKIKRGGREGGTYEVLRPCHLQNLKRAPGLDNILSFCIDCIIKIIMICNNIQMFRQGNHYAFHISLLIKHVELSLRAVVELLSKSIVPVIMIRGNSESVIWVNWWAQIIGNTPRGGTSILGGRGELGPKFASEILVGVQILPPKI